MIRRLKEHRSGKEFTAQLSCDTTPNTQNSSSQTDDVHERYCNLFAYCRLKTKVNVTR